MTVEATQNQGPVRAGDDKALLRVDDVTHRYPNARTGRPALSHVNMSLDNNEVIAVVGESGCGKTTLGRIVSRLVEPSSGHVLLDGQDVWKFNRRELRAYRPTVQVVQQDPYGSINPALTVVEVIGGGLLRHKLASRRTVNEQVLRLLGQVGLDATPDFLTRFPHQLSGGQRQRLAIARAISLKPRLIIADEAVSMLDVSMRVSVLDLLLDLRKDRDLAYMFISHDFGVVRYFATGGRIMVMFFGVVVEEGPTEDLIRRPRHPYTYLLLESIPVPDPALAQRESAQVDTDEIEGEPAATGCIFANRCPFVEDICRAERPPLVEKAPGHKVACHFPEKVPQPDTVGVASNTTTGNGASSS